MGVLKNTECMAAKVDLVSEVSNAVTQAISKKVDKHAVPTFTDFDDRGILVKPSRSEVPTLEQVQDLVQKRCDALEDKIRSQETSAVGSVCSPSEVHTPSGVVRPFGSRQNSDVAISREEVEQILETHFAENFAEHIEAGTGDEEERDVYIPRASDAGIKMTSDPEEVKSE